MDAWHLTRATVVDTQGHICMEKLHLYRVTVKLRGICPLTVLVLLPMNDTPDVESCSKLKALVIYVRFA